MEIVKAFTTNKMHTEIVIKGTINDPLFRTSDIAEILELNNVRSSVKGFDDSEKVVHKTPTLGGLQEVSFLTEKGLYKLLFRSRKPIASQFQNWACEVIKEIRLHGIYDLKKEMQQLEDKHKQEIEQQKITEREKVLLKEYASIGSIVYVIRVKTLNNGKYIVKIGESRKGIAGRYTEHKKKL